MNFRKVVLFTSLFICVFYSPVRGQLGSGSITGYVYSDKRVRLERIHVELLDEFSRAIARVQTDGSGRYSFFNLSAGRYKVRVIPFTPDLEEQIVDVEITSFSRQMPGGGTVTSGTSRISQDIYLKSKKGSAEAGSKEVFFAQEVPDAARKSFENAVISLENKRIEEGIQRLKDAVNSFPDYFLALEKLGLEYIKLQNYTEAARFLDKAAKINQKSFNSWYGLGFSNYALKNSEAAISASQKAVTLKPSSVEALLIMGLAFRQAARFEEAEKSLKQAKSVSNNSSADANWNLALLYAYNLKKYNLAASELESFLKNNPDYENKEAIKKLIKQFQDKVQQN